MRKNIFLLLTSLLFSVAAEARVEAWCGEESCALDRTNFYAKAFGGANFLQKTTISGTKTHYHTRYVISGALGYRWSSGLCLEGEYAFRRNGLLKIDFVGEGSSHHGHFQTSSYMANLLWDVPLKACGCSWGDLRPFIGAGMGFDVQQMHSSNSRVTFNQKWRSFSWQVMTGLAYPIFCRTDLSLEYKFHQGSCRFYNHTVGVGLIYKFGFGIL